jgi:hypothetical protein
MDERVARTIGGLATFDALATFEANAKRQNRFDDEISAAVNARAVELGKALVAERTGLDLTHLSPAEEKIVLAAAEYAALKKRQGRNTQRMFNQLQNRGLLEAAEVSVQKSKPTEGYHSLEEEGLKELSYEQIVVDHPDEFSPRAVWYSKRTLGLPLEMQTPPAKSTTPVQSRTETLLRWLQKQSAGNGGYFPHYSNANAAAALDMGDLRIYGRAYGNIVSRMDFACYKVGLPPLGLTAEAPFAEAWQQQDRTWAYPVPSMQAAAQAHKWTEKDFTRVLAATETLPGQAYLIWQAENHDVIRAWAFGLEANGTSSPRGEERDVPSDIPPYWVFVCNPKKWAIDRFLDRSIEFDSWGVRDSDQNKFAPGQLAIVRVGVDRRNNEERQGKPPLEPGIYGLCEVTSVAYPAAGAHEECW